MMFSFFFQRNTRGIVNPADCLKFQVEERIQCSASKKVKYNNRTELILPLQISLDAATNKGLRFPFAITFTMAADNNKVA